MNTLNLNKNIYSLDIIFSAAYSLMEKAYFLFDEDDKNFIVMIEPKQANGINIENNFKEELLNYLNYSKKLSQTKELRQLILKRALLLTDIQEDNENTNHN